MDITKTNPPVARQEIRPLDWLPFVLLVGLTALLYSKALNWWYIEWTAPGSFYAHGVFIPFFVGLMVWRDRERLRRLPMGRVWWGLPLILAAILIVMYAHRVGSRVTLSVSFILFLIGVSLVLAGKSVTRALLFPMLFLFTMIPLLPDTVINVIAFPIQLISAKMATFFLGLMTLEPTCSGTTISMPNYTLAVELPCSGFKTLIGLMSFAAAFAYLVEGALWKRWALFLTAIPLAILVNGVRITLIGVAGELVSSHAAATFHDYSGFIVLILGFMVLFSLARWLRCDRFLGIDLQDPPKEGAGEGASGRGGEDGVASRKSQVASEESRVESAGVGGPTTPQSHEPTTQRPEDTAAALDAKYGPPRTDTLRRLTGGVIPLVILLAAACAVKAFVRPPAPPDPRTWLAKAEVPVLLEGGKWKMDVERPIDPDIQKELKPLIWIDRDYIEMGESGARIHLLINGGKERGTFHDPHDCFPAGGYELKDLGPETIPTPVGPVKVQVSQATNRENRETTLLMFVFLMDGEQFQTTRDFKWKLITRSLLGDSGHPSYFIRFRQWNTGNGEDRKEELRRFIRAMWTCIGQKVLEGRSGVETAAR